MDALADHQVDLDQDSTQKLTDGYDSLSVFSDTPPGLAILLDNPKFIPVVFSNRTTSMVSNSVLRSKDLSPYAGIFHDTVPVDANRKFKPAPEAGNPFDVMVAINVGMKAAWVDRAMLGWIDSMNVDATPSVPVKDLNDAVLTIESLEC
ncbi:hypothetical protein GX50_05792 [[Emmonsia] crescens]|uniref:Uncharacterized protein n=1 Tax=[Emmonsia] crescens TaxID=73230 RepID=A0A2B7ZE63_9EURO|nr:hypothetical protein GX50_05792 [Emmonsia crescens]